MATMTKNQFNSELDSLTQLLNSMIMEEATKATNLGTISALRGRVGELAASPDGLLSDLDSFKTSVANAFKLDDYNKIISKFYYAIDSYDVFKVGRLSAQVQTATTIDEKLAFINEFMTKFNSIVSQLKAQRIADDNLNALVDSMSNRNARNFDNATEKASNAVQELDELEQELASVRDEKARNIVIQKIDKQIKKLNSTNKALLRLQKKVGKIEPHQHSVKVKASQITALRNQTIVNASFNSSEINSKLANLRAAYQRQASATTAAEIFQAKRDIKKAEKAIYGGKLTKRKAEKIDQAIAERNRIIANAKTIQIDSNRAYRSKFNKTMTKLQQIDKKIIGKKNSEALYAGLAKKAGYLIGGTGLTLPRQVVELDNSIAAARR